MTEAQALALYNRMRAVWPSQHQRATVEVWVQYLSGLGDITAQHAFEACVKSSRFFPSIADMEEHAASIRERQRIAMPALNAPAETVDPEGQARVREILNELRTKWKSPARVVGGQQ